MTSSLSPRSSTSTMHMIGDIYHLDALPKMHAQLTDTFNSGKLKSLLYRKHQLLQLAKMIQENEERIQEALMADMMRPAFETNFAELTATLYELKNTYKHISSWSKPHKPPFSFHWSPHRRSIHKTPKGVVLIISPFNYPIFLSLVPLASALAAGNCVVIKPSDAVPKTSSLIEQLVKQYLDPEVVRVVNGGIQETSQLLELPWGHVLFTGSQKVGKIVAAAAAKHLTPVTLELGGKNPVFLDSTSLGPRSLARACRRILWGKSINAGQTCIAPDYLFVLRHEQDRVIRALRDAHAELYPTGSPPPGSFTRLVNDQAFQRVAGLLRASRGQVVIGGELFPERRYIAPTVVKGVPIAGDALLDEEIFGPILPIVPVDSWEEAMEYVGCKGREEYPLTVYVFSDDERFKKTVIENTQSGSAVVNETIIHILAQDLPFGGVGGSGYGSQTGKFGFDTFSHHRAVMDSPGFMERILSFRYPPYTSTKTKLMRTLFGVRFPAHAR